MVPTTLSSPSTAIPNGKSLSVCWSFVLRSILLPGNGIQRTSLYLPSGAHMVLGAGQRCLLTQLASMTQEGLLLELGTFTGYATACFVEGAANAGRAIVATYGYAQDGPYVMLSMERETCALNLASAHLGILAQYGLGDNTEPQQTKPMHVLQENDNNKNNKGIPG
jgi:hypothetical protein